MNKRKPTKQFYKWCVVREKPMHLFIYVRLLYKCKILENMF